MRITKTVKNSVAAFALVTLMAGSAVGCSSSLAPAGSSAETTGTATAGPTAASSAQPSAAASESASSADATSAEAWPREGSPAQWKEITVAGASKRALVPQGPHPADGSIVFKGTQGVQEFTFSAAIPEGVSGASPVLVKVISADDSKPVMVTVNPGSTEKLSVPVSGAEVVKIVWNTKGQPASGESIAFFDFTVK